MKAVDIKSGVYLLKSISWRARTEEENKIRDDGEIVKFPVTDKSYVSPVENGTATNVCFFDGNYYYQASSLARIKQN